MRLMRRVTRRLRPRGRRSGCLSLRLRLRLDVPNERKVLDLARARMQPSRQVVQLAPRDRREVRRRPAAESRREELKLDFEVVILLVLRLAIVLLVARLPRDIVTLHDDVVIVAEELASRLALALPPPHTLDEAFLLFPRCRAKLLERNVMQAGCFLEGGGVQSGDGRDWSR